MKTGKIGLHQFAALASIVFTSTLILSSVSHARAATADSRIDQDILEQMHILYGLDHDQAMERLAREDLATETYFRIRSLNLKSYAGEWFDAETLNLHVASNDPADHKLIERLGARPVAVTFSLAELEAARTRAQALLEHRLPVADAVRESYIDYRTNRVVLGIAPDQLRRAEVMLDDLGLELGMVHITELKGQIVSSSGNVRGAEGTRNHTWQQQPGGTWPCSITAPVEGGYVTAGHCGGLGNEMRTSVGQTLGFVADSTYEIVSGLGQYKDNKDGGWVETISGWTPVPQINGYDDGTISISAAWAGVLEGPVGTTVCRYGQTSGGPYCGQIDQKGYNFTSLSGHYFTGFVKAKPMCSDDGDSGGPYVTASGQVQGTNKGGNPTNNCPSPGSPIDPGHYAVYQPIQTTLDYFVTGPGWLRMLTPHGAVKPAVYGVNCAGTGWGTYRCSFDYYNSQGKTEVLWDSTTGSSGQSTYFSDYCYPGDQVNVSLYVSNPYGTRYWSTAFSCPS